MSEQAVPFNPRLVAGMIVAGLFAFVALLLLLAYGGGAAPQPDGRAHVQSVAATGYKGLVTLTRRFRKVPYDFGAEDLLSEDLLVVALDTDSRPDQVRTLIDQRKGRATLFILPKWHTVRDPIRRGWVRALGPGAGHIAGTLFGRRINVHEHGAPVPRRAEGVKFLSGLSLPVPDRAQLVNGPGLSPLVGLGSGDALVAQIDDQPHYLLADPDLLNNHGLRDPARARAALALLDSLNSTGAEGIMFDTSSAAVSAQGASFLKVAFEPPFLALTLALAAAALLAALQGVFRFGPIRQEERAIAFGKSALVENGAGLIRLAGREARLGAAYVDVIRDEAIRLTGASSKLNDVDLEAYLDRIGKSGAPSFSQLAEAVRQSDDRYDLVASARALFQWKKEMIR